MFSYVVPLDGFLSLSKIDSAVDDRKLTALVRCGLAQRFFAVQVLVEGFEAQSSDSLAGLATNHVAGDAEGFSFEPGNFSGLIGWF